MSKPTTLGPRRTEDTYIEYDWQENDEIGQYHEVTPCRQLVSDITISLLQLEAALGDVARRTEVIHDRGCTDVCVTVSADAFDDKGKSAMRSEIKEVEDRAAKRPRKQNQRRQGVAKVGGSSWPFMAPPTAQDTQGSTRQQGAQPLRQRLTIGLLRETRIPPVPALLVHLACMDRLRRESSNHRVSKRLSCTAENVWCLMRVNTHRQSLPLLHCQDRM
jgi:hypothetical protein